MAQKGRVAVAPVGTVLVLARRVEGSFRNPACEIVRWFLTNMDFQPRWMLNPRLLLSSD